MFRGDNSDNFDNADIYDDEENIEVLFDNDFEFNNIDIDNLDVYKLDSFNFEEIIATLSNEDIIKLFDRVIKRIKETPEESYTNNQLIKALPSNIRIKYIDYYNFDLWDALEEFIDGMVDEEDIYNVAKKALKSIKNDDIYSVGNIFKFVPQSKKIDFLDCILEKEVELKEEIIDSITIVDYLMQFDIDKRFYVIKNIIFKKFQTNYEYPIFNYEPNVRFNPWRYSQILESFVDEHSENLQSSEMFKTLEFLVEESKKIKDSDTKETIGITNSEEIVKVFYEHGYDPKEVIKFLANSGTLDKNFELCNIVAELPLELRKDVTIFMLSMDCEDRKMSQMEFFSSLDSLNLIDAEELFVKYCILEKRFDYMDVINNRFSIDRKRSSFDYLNIIFKHLSSEELSSSFDRISVVFSEITTFPKYDEKYNLIVSTFSKRYNLDNDKLLLFTKQFGYDFLKYLGNESIRKYFDADEQSLNKLFLLFSDDSTIINKNVINDILNSLLQRQFMIDQPNIYNIFSTFEYLVQSNNLDGVKELLDKISNEFDFTKILEKNNCSVNELYNQVISCNFDLLHEITNSYIAYKRELFVREKLQNAYEMLSMKKVVTRESYKNEILNNGYSYICDNCKQLVNVKFTQEQLFLMENSDLMWELIQFKKNPKEYELDNKYKRYLKILNELLNIMYENKVDFNDYNASYSHCQHLQFEFVQDAVSNDFLVGILLESNYEGVMNVLADDDNFNSLKEYLERYKIVGWQNMFSKLMAKASIQFDEGTVGSLISNYSKIKTYIDNKSSLTSIIDYSNCYSVLSNFYRLLFGQEDYTLIAANDGKNRAAMTKYDRLNGCESLIPLMYRKEKFTIPTLDEKFTLSNGKNIEIVVGNATNMMNLTYGERTESCMRKGGAYNSLFEHCVTDKNGFHIRFVNPKTGNFVSRVSGTRNGNTLFLNELRNSLDDEYSNEDLYDAIKKFSKRLIQLSYNSEMPIDNVIITSDYALEGHKDENQMLNLSLEDKKEAFRNISFNFSDVGILLASSNNEGKIMPYKFSENVPCYDSIRDDIKYYYGTNAVYRMIQLRMINDLINGVPNEKISLEYLGENPDYVVSGEDFYIACYKEKAEVFVIDSRKDNQRTIAEINDILKQNYGVLNSTISKGVSR